MTTSDPTSPASPISATSLDDAARAADDEAQHRTAIVASYPSAAFASMVVARLAGEGIASRLVDEETAGIAPHLAIAIDGVKVAVAERELDRARAIVRDIEDGAFDDGAHDDARVSDVDDARPIGMRDADRALAAALVGAMFVPPAALYSLFVAVRALRSGERRARAAFAVVVDVAVVAMWTHLALSFFRIRF